MKIAGIGEGARGGVVERDVNTNVAGESRVGGGAGCAARIDTC